MLFPNRYRVIFIYFSSIILFGSLSSFAGKWMALAQEGDIQALQVAREKHEKYHLVTLEPVVLIGSFVASHVPDLNPDMISAGLWSFFRGKEEKWKIRAQFLPSELQQMAEKARDAKALLASRPKNDDEWQWVLEYATNQYSVVYLHKYAISGLERVTKKANELLLPGNNLSFNEMLSISLMTLLSSNLLNMMSVKNELLRYQTLSNNLKQKLLALMEVDDWSPFQSRKKPIVVLVDVDMWKDRFSDLEAGGFGEKRNPLRWNKSEPFSEKFGDWGHGDKMISLVRMVSPNATCHILNADTTHFDPCSEALAAYYADSISNPVVFNFSISPPGNHLFFEHTSDGIKFACKSDISKKRPDHAGTIRAMLEIITPGYNFEQALEKTAIAALQDDDDNNISKLTPKRVQQMVIGPKNDQTHLIVASPANEPGILKSEGYHLNTVKLLESAETREHGLIALNYNFMTKKLEERSHQAGDYQDIAVVVPSAIVCATDSDESLPNFFYGGHSSATAFLSAIVSRVRDYYPSLTHEEVKQCILRGANRNIPGYNVAVHGQGMVSLRGALNEARRISEEQKEN